MWFFANFFLLIILSVIFRYSGDSKRYNLPLVESYLPHLRLPLYSPEQLDKFNGMLIKVPMPNRSLIVMYGPPRYQFEHSVLRLDVQSRRVCIAYREFTPIYLESGEHFANGEPISQMATSFWLHDVAVDGNTTKIL